MHLSKFVSLFLLFHTVCPRPSGGSTSICSTDGTSFSLVVVIADGLRTISTSGCPPYDWTGESTPNSATIKASTYKIPSEPTLCSAPTRYLGVYSDLLGTIENTSPVFNTIGVAFNGVALYGNSDGDFDDAYIAEGDTFDQCNGHAGPNGQYHYHSQIPDECLFNTTSSDYHSDLFAFLADGFPLFGPYGDDGIIPTDLDECNGHVDETYPFYHYHVAADFEYPYTVNCLRGKVDTDIWPNFAGAEDCIESEEQYDYSSLYEIWDDVNPPETQPNSSSGYPVMGTSLTVLLLSLTIFLQAIL